ncbi:alkaline phosphatase family protein [Sinomonas sp. ASV322]|uniref:phospholipase C n=1 Tax=Sinomonas sp. ASV322 TaxID=3041920 RepID=UPI0027DEA86F|nr:alkaline phosphatase family protein [Sinomonas sp. ASV322]MDQ4503145.1 alkaline phosphatase family protein [Sinomonas sp. ASV322]
MRISGVSTRKYYAAAAAAALFAVAITACGGPASSTSTASSASGAFKAASQVDTNTPIKHLVVIFQENVSFDHYFGTYPNAANTDGTPFKAGSSTPSVDGLSQALLTQNPNAAQPVRLGGAKQQVTCDQDHEYKDEQEAFNSGKMDKFVEHTEVAEGTSCKAPLYGPKGLVMDYYDGNSVTALWNYAQHFAMSDNSYGTTFGPSTPGALNLVAGQTHGVVKEFMPGDKPFPKGEVLENAGNKQGTIVGDPQPFGDDCSTRDQAQLSSDNKNIGDLLNAKGVSWGWFEGGFKPTETKDGKAVCGTKHNVGVALGGTGKDGALPFGSKDDYIAHHEPFQYYASTANPHHLAPTSTDLIGSTDQANHQYDLTDFWTAADAGKMPAVSYLKAPGYQDGHAAYSDPIDEQQFLVETINHLQKLPDWKDTAVVIAYDDSDGWYDHKASKIVNSSKSDEDSYGAEGQCGTGDPSGGYQGRCGYGPRLPLLVVSPFAKANFVDHTLTDQSSVLKFIEDNWKTGRIGDSSFDEKAGSIEGMFDFGGNAQPALQLDPKTGAPTS